MRLMRGGRWIDITLFSTIASSTLFGSVLASQQAETFPSLSMMGYRIRVEECIVIIGFVACCMARVARFSGGKQASSGVRLPPPLVSVWTATGLCICVLQGLLAGNSDSLEETRMLIVPLMFLGFTLYWISEIDIESLSDRLWHSMKPLVMVINCFELLPTLRERAGEELAGLGVTYGGDSPNVEIILMYFYCQALTRVVVGARRRRPSDAWWLAFVSAGFASRVYKPSWVNAAVALVVLPLVVLVSGGGASDREAWRARAGRRWVATVVGLALVMGVGIWGLQTVSPGRFDEYLTVASDRVRRPDVDYDLTGGRATLISLALQKFSESVWLGQGIGRWVWVERADASGHRRVLATVPDHFSPLWVAMRGGVFLLAALFLLCVWYLKTGAHTCRNCGPSLRAPVITHFVFSIVVISYSMFGVPQGLLEAMLLFYVSCVIVLRTAWAVHQRTARQPCETYRLSEVRTRSYVGIRCSGRLRFNAADALIDRAG